MRLVDSLAARRRIYPRALITMPDLMVIDVAPAFRSASLPLGRYYPVILETDAEIAEMSEFLLLDRPFPVPPDLFDYRPSALETDDIIIGRYDPPEAGWPWLLLCHWPPSYVALAPDPVRDFARGCYTIETFASFEEADRATQLLLASLGHRSNIPVRDLGSFAVRGRA